MSFSQALSGLSAQSENIKVISNNIANSQTVGFKNGRISFADIFAGSSRIGLGTQVAAVTQDFRSGDFINTGRSLDLAIAGQGFYRLEYASGQEVVYSRNGQFNRDASGFLINDSGQYLTGYGLTDPANPFSPVNVGAAPERLFISEAEMPANATQNVSTTYNLDASFVPGEGTQELNGLVIGETSEVSGRFLLNDTPPGPFPAPIDDIANPLATYDFNYSEDILVYDDEGNENVLTLYFEQTVAGPPAEWTVRPTLNGIYDGVTVDTLTFDADGNLTSGGNFDVRLAREDFDLPADQRISIDLASSITAASDSQVLPIAPTSLIDAQFRFDSREAPGITSVTEPGRVTDNLGADNPLLYHSFEEMSIYDNLGNERTLTLYFEKIIDGPPSEWTVKPVLDGVYDGLTVETLNFDADGALATVPPTLDFNFAPGDYTTIPLGGLVGTLPIQVDLAGSISAADNFALQQVKINGDTENSLVEDSGPKPIDFHYSSTFSGYDSLGNQRSVSTYFTKIEDNLWEARVLLDGQRPSWDGEADYTVRFNEDGSLATPAINLTDPPSEIVGGTPEELAAGQLTLTFANDIFTLDGAETISFDFDIAGTTQFTNPSTQKTLEQDGYSSGSLVGIEVMEDGTVMRVFTNEERRAAGQVVLANFINPEGLQPDGDNGWRASIASGEPILGEGGTGIFGTVMSETLENSNVDLAQELVNMIVAQRAYQANSSSIGTQDEMLQTVINL